MPFKVETKQSGFWECINKKVEVNIPELLNHYSNVKKVKLFISMLQYTEINFSQKNNLIER